MNMHKLYYMMIIGYGVASVEQIGQLFHLQRNHNTTFYRTCAVARAQWRSQALKSGWAQGM